MPPVNLPPGLYNTLLVRYGEVALKSKQTRRRLERDLVTQLRAGFRYAGIKVQHQQVEPGRIFFKFVPEDLPTAVERARGVFGVYGVSPCAEVPATLADITRQALAIGAAVLKPGQSFAMRVRRRMGSHPFSSMEVARKVGAAVLEHFQDLTLHVDLTTPDTTIYVEIRGAVAYLFHLKVPAVGGMPLESQAPLFATTLGRREDLVATLLMAKRGSRSIPVVFETSGWSEFPTRPGLSPLTSKDLQFLVPRDTSQPGDLPAQIPPFVLAYLRYLANWHLRVGLVGVILPFNAVHAALLTRFSDNPARACLACHLVRARLLPRLRDTLEARGFLVPISVSDGDHPYIGCPASPRLYQLLYSPLPFWVFHPLVGFSTGALDDLSKEFEDLGLGPAPKLDAYCPLARQSSQSKEPFADFRNLSTADIDDLAGDINLEDQVEILLHASLFFEIEDPNVLR